VFMVEKPVTAKTTLKPKISALSHWAITLISLATWGRPPLECEGHTT
jgi:hypothetical protein